MSNQKMTPLPMLDVNGVAKECKGCGACCIFTFPGSHVLGVILELGEEKNYPGQVIKAGNGFHLKVKFTSDIGYHCVMFDTHNRVCTIYKDRPSMCQDWKVWHGCREDIQHLQKLAAGDIKPKRIK